MADPRLSSHPINVLLVDDSNSFRRELRTLLELEGDIRVLGEARNGWEAIQQTNALRPDVVLMDHNMPSLSGVDATRRIKEKHPDVKVLFVAAEETWRQDAISAGAEDYFIKDTDIPELLEAIQKLNGGRARLPESPLAPAPRSVARAAPSYPRLARQTVDVARAATVRVAKGALLSISGFLLLVAILFFPAYVLPALGLSFGSLFFLYALKYYGTVALLLFGNGVNGNGNGNGNGSASGNGINGLNGHANGNGHDLLERLPHVPFISIHLPLYNEAQVVDRLLSACTALNYPHYEIIVADDSTDETTQILHARWASHPKVTISHRKNRQGFKGGALKQALTKADPRAEFITVFDADFIPPPDILQQFLAYFYGVNGHNLQNSETRLVDDRLAAVQGYQWHVLNASENWITKGVRAEFSGSYVVERSGQQLLGSLKMIAGSVFMIRSDVLRKHGWGTSITEDWELTLRLYLDGYKVLYSPFIQAPAECVANFKQLVKQRMRWAEGHTFNVKKFFWHALLSPNLSIREKLEFLYYTPYYLQSVLFMIGTASWLLAELVFHQALPRWSALWGWSLVFANTFSLVLMNLSGLFLERGVRRNWSGLLSFVLLTYLLVPYQAYAALKGLLEPEEGGWHRTQKTGAITEVLDKFSLGKKLKRLLPGKEKKGKAVDLEKRLGVVTPAATTFVSGVQPSGGFGPAVAALGPAPAFLMPTTLVPIPTRWEALRGAWGRRFRALRKNRAFWLAWLLGRPLPTKRRGPIRERRYRPTSVFPIPAAGHSPAFYLILFLATGLVLLGVMSTGVPFVAAAPDSFYLRDTTTNGASPAGEDMNTAQGSTENTLTFDTVNQDAYWYTDLTYPTGNDDASIAAGDYTLNMYFSSLPASGATVSTGTCTIPDTASSVNCTVSPNLTDTTKTLLVFQATSSNNTPSSSSVRCYLTSTSNITCDRDGTAGAANIAWQTAEFSSGVTVEHLTPVCNEDGDADPDITNVAISAVSSMSNTFLLYSHKTSGTTYDRNDHRTVRLTSTTNVEIRQDGYGSCATGSEGALQVVQYTNASVTRGETGPMTGTTTLPVTGLSSVDTSKTVLLYSYRVSGGGADICARMVRGEIDAATSLSFTRSDGAAGCAGDDIISIAWERIEFTDATTVQQVEPAMTGSITVESRVSQSSDDAEQCLSDNSMYLDSSDLELVRDDNPGGGSPCATDQEVGMRFQNVTIPQGAYITNAYIEFETDETDTESTNLTFWGEDADTTATFTITNSDITNRTKTTASVAWNNVPSWNTVSEKHQTPDLSSIIQEIVDRAGWASGNSLAIIVNGTGQRIAESWDGESANAPLLHIEYAGGTTTANVTIASVDTTRTVVLAGGQHTAGQGHGEGTYKADDIIGAMLGRHSLTSSTNLQVVRDDTNGTARWSSYVVQFPEPSGSVDITVTVSHTDADGSPDTTIVTSSTTIDASTANPFAFVVGNDTDGETYTSSNPQRLRVQIHVDAVNGGGAFTLVYDSTANPTNLATPSITVADVTVLLLSVVVFIPLLTTVMTRNRRLASRLIVALLSFGISIGLLASQTPLVSAAPDSFYLHDSGAGGWYNTDWGYRKQITIQASQVPSDLSYFPVLVNLSSDAQLSANAQTDGGDILFTDSNGTKLDHEIEKYVSGTGELVAWVEVPSLSGTANTTLYMYYGNATVADQWNIAGTWDEGGANSFKGVWHLDEDAAGTGNADLYQDSTSNNNHGDDNVSATDKTGKIGLGQQFDDVDDTINNIPDPNVGTQVTVSAWVNLTNVNAERDRFVSLQSEVAVLRHDGANSVGQLHFYVSTSGTLRHIRVDGALSAGQWYYVVGTSDGTNQILYQNGTQVGSATPPGTLDADSGLRMSSTVEVMDGYIDEVRISGTPRSADWITTEYNNQSSPSTFYSLGTQETPVSPGGKSMNTTLGTGAATLTFDTLNQNAYWYTDLTYPTGNDDASIAAGDYTLNMYLSSLPRPWWNSNYPYSRQIIITAGSATIPSGYTVCVSFDHQTLVANTKSLSSGDDVRVAYWNGSNWSEIDRVLDPNTAWDSTSTGVCFSTQASISASATDANYKLHYGYLSATSPPAATANVFEFYDDFDDNDVTDWTSFTENRPAPETACNPGGFPTVSVTGGVVSIDPPEDWCTAGTKHNTFSVSNTEGFAIRTRSRLTDAGGSYDDQLPSMWYVSLDGSNYINNLYASSTRDGSHRIRLIEKASPPGTDLATVTTAGVPVANTWYLYESLVLPNGNMRWDRDGSQVVPASGWANDVTYTSGGIAIGSERVAAEWDWITVRKLVDPEPSVSLASEVSSSSVEIIVTVSHTDADGGNPASIVQSSATAIDSSTASPLAISIGTDSDGETYSSSNPQRLRVQINISSLNGSESFTLAYDSTSNPTNLATPSITVADVTVLLLAVVVFIPILTTIMTRNRRLASRLIVALLSFGVSIGLLASQTPVVTAAPDSFYLRDTTANGASPAGEDMNTSQGSTENTLVFDTVDQDAYWYTDLTYPTGSDDASIASGNYTLNMYLSSLPSSWWDSNYAKRQRITISAGSSSIPSGYPVKLTFDHNALVNAVPSLSQADGDDIRIAYWNGSAWSELDRALADGSSWNSASTTILFRSQASIAASGTDNNYYLHYDNGSAINPPTSAPSARYYLAESLTETQTSSTSYATKVSLNFTPSATSEHWVVVSSWRQRHVGSAGSTVDLGRARVTLNGSTRTGDENISYRQSGDIWKAFAALFKVTGVSTQQTVTIDFRARGSADAIDNARILAFMIPDPTNADIQYAEDLTPTTDTVNPTDSQTLTFSPSSAGDYVWMANGFFHEAPGGASSGGMFLEDEAGADQQSSGESYISSTDPEVVPITHFEQRNLTTGSKSFSFRHQPDTTTGSERQGLTQILFRSDVFEGLEAADSPGQSTTGGQTYVEKTSLTTATQSSARDYVYLAVTMHDDTTGGSLTAAEYAEVRLAGTQQLEDVKALSRSSYDTQLAWGYAENTTGNRTLDLRFKADAGVTAETQYAHILALRYKEPSLSLSSQEDAASVDITVTVSHTTSTGGTPTTIVSSPTTIDANTGNFLAFTVGNDSDGESYASSNPQRLRVHITVDAVSAGASFTLAYDSAANPSGLDTPSITVPELSVGLLAVVVLVPILTASLVERRRRAMRLISVLLSISVALGMLAGQVPTAKAAPDAFYLHDSSTGSSDWYNTDWLYRKKITVQSAQVSADQSGFPVYLDLADLGADFFSHVNSDGGDIRITKADGTTELARQVVATDTGAQTGEVHFKADSLSGSANTDFYVYYGNASASDYAATATYGAQNVWDANYVGVWHLDEASSSTRLDSTSGGNDVADNNTVAAATGKLGTAANFVAANTEFLSITDAAQTGLDVSSQFTLEAWAKPADTSSTRSFVAKHGNGTSAFYAYNLRLSGTRFTLTYSFDGTTSTNLNGTSGSVSVGNWYYAVGTYDGSQVKIFQNGSEQNSALESGTIFDSNVDFNIGARNNGTQAFDGDLDEVRVSTIARSSDWILSQFNNQNSPSTFYSVGAEESGISPAGKTMNTTEGTGAATLAFDTVNQDAYWYTDITYPTGSDDASIAAGNYTLNMYFFSLPASWYDTDWGFRKKITIQASQVPSDQSYFPVLINLSSDTQLSSNAQTDGGDILFTSSNGTSKLDHEIEKYVSGTGELVAWVEVPSLSGTANTVLYMYYGNATVADQQNATGVWDANYVGVWHLKEDPSGAAPQMKDSTSNANHGTTSGMVPGNQVSGRMDGSLDFDGTDDYVDLPEVGDGWSGITVSAWIKVDVLPASWLALVTRDKTGGTTPDDVFALMGRDGPGTGPSMRVYRAPGNTPASAISPTPLSTSTWYYLTGTYDGANVRIYTDNAQSASASATGVLSTGVSNVIIGDFSNPVSSYNQDGIIDEVRISDIARSAGWIATDHNNQNSPSTFYSLGTEESAPYVNVSVTVSHTDADGSPDTAIVSSSTTIDANTGNFLAFTVGNDSDGETYFSSNPQRLRVQVHVNAVSGGGSFTLAFDSAADPTNLTTPTVTVPEIDIFLLVLVPLIPVLMTTVWRKRRLAGQMISVLLAISIGIGLLAQDVPAVKASPDNFYFRDTTTNGASPSGEDMNGTQGSTENTLTFNTVNQDAHWYTDITYPTGNDPASIAAGDYILNMNFNSLPSAGATVQTGTCTIGAGSTSSNCTISPALSDTTKTILIFQATSSNNTPESSSVRCYLTSTSNITCDRYATTGTVNIAWQTAEFTGGVTVEHLTPVCNEDGDADPDITNVAITPVSDMTKTFVLYSHKTSGVAYDWNDPRTVRLTSTSNVEIQQYPLGSCAAGSEGALQVVQYTSASVTRGETAAMTGTSLPVTGLSSVDTSKTMLLYSYRFSGGGAAMCDRMLRGQIDSATSLSFSRGDGAGGCDTQQIDAIAWERIEFTDGTSVQQAEPAMSGSITVESYVTQSSDDAEEHTTGAMESLTSSDLELVEESDNQVVGVRFQNINVPQGGYITNAWVEFTTDKVHTVQTDLTFHGEDADTTATFASTDNNITLRPTTTASVDWNNVPAPSAIGEKQRSPDLSPVIQEIVDRTGWASGNSMVLIVTGTPGSKREVESWNGANGHGDLTLAPLLHIEYAGGVGTANVGISSVDTGRTIVFAGGQHTAGQAIGEGTYKGDDVIGAMLGRHSLTSSTNLQVIRDDTSGNARWTSYVVQFPTAGSVDVTVTVSHTDSDGSPDSTIVFSSTTIDANTGDFLAFTVGNDSDGESYSSSNPQRLRVQIHVDSVTNGGSFVLAYDSAANPSGLQTPTVVVPEAALGLALGALLIPGLSGLLWRRRRERNQAPQASQDDPAPDRTVPQRKE